MVDQKTLIDLADEDRLVASVSPSGILFAIEGLMQLGDTSYVSRRTNELCMSLLATGKLHLVHERGADYRVVR